MTIFAHGRCPVKSCPHNHGDEGVSCGFAGYNTVCMHPRFKAEWWDRTGGIVPSPVDVEAGAQSLTARASRASRAAVELSPLEARQRAEQLALQLEV